MSNLENLVVPRVFGVLLLVLLALTFRFLGGIIWGTEIFVFRALYLLGIIGICSGVFSWLFLTKESKLKSYMDRLSAFGWRVILAFGIGVYGIATLSSKGENGSWVFVPFRIGGALLLVLVLGWVLFPGLFRILENTKKGEYFARGWFGAMMGSFAVGYLLVFACFCIGSIYALYKYIVKLVS